MRPNQRRVPGLYGLAPISITCLLGSESRGEQPWATFTSKEGRFSIEIPVQPVKSETHQQSFGGTVSNHIDVSVSGVKGKKLVYDASPAPAHRFLSSFKLTR